MTKQAKVPSLRFPEFHGDWEEKKFGDVLEFINTNSYSRSQLNDSSGSIKNVHYGDIHTKFNSLFKIKEEQAPYLNSNIETSKIPEEQFCKEGDLVIVDASEDYSDIGKSIEIIDLQDEDLVSGLHTFLARDIAEFALGFKSFLMKSSSVRKQIMRIAQGISVLGISKKQLSKILLFIPSLPEQRKIADFLSSVDSRIQMLTEKKELLEQYKKGMMQKLFSQEIRFKDDNGNDYPDWEEKKLGEVLQFVNSNSYSRDQLNYEEGSVRNVHYGDIHTKYNSLLKVKEAEIPYINPNIDTTKMSNEQFVKEGDLIIADASENYEDVGKCVEIIDLQDYKLVAGLHTFIARDISIFALGFKSLLMQSQNVRKQIMRIAQGISVLGISKKNLSKILLNIPPLPEQQKIADFLSAIDTKIELVNTLIEQSKEYKKGLLQKLLI
jgi:type I restriction enzyme S subunit